jgi:putative endonuclease
MHHVYIIFSEKLNRFYIGYTADDPDERLRKHNTNHKGFTGKTNDWTLKHLESFDSKTEALLREKIIKKQKSRKFIEKLISHS